MRCLGSVRGDGEATTGLWLGKGDGEGVGEGIPASGCGPHEATTTNTRAPTTDRAQLAPITDSVSVCHRHSTVIWRPLAILSPAHVLRDARLSVLSAPRYRQRGQTYPAVQGRFGTIRVLEDFA